MPLINHNTIEQLKKNNCKLVTCEFGTAGLIANTLNSDNNHQVYLASLVFHDFDTLLKFFAIANKKKIADLNSDITNALLRKISADIGFSTFINNNHLYLTIIIYDRIYQYDAKLSKIDTKQKAAIAAMSYFSSFIEKYTK
jgi:hypothetical protein